MTHGDPDGTHDVTLGGTRAHECLADDAWSLCHVALGRFDVAWHRRAL